MTFQTALAAVPYQPRGTDAAGLLPPIFAASSHILFATACAAEVEKGNAVATDEEILGEITHASAHWDAIDRAENLSAPSIDLLNDFGALLAEAIADYPNWTGQQRVTNLRDIANRVRAVGASLDRELVGLTTTDPGRNL